MTEKLVLVLISGVTGILFGYISSILIERFKRRMDYHKELFFLFQKVTDNLNVTLSQMASFNVSFNSINKEKLETLKKEVSTMYFRYYNLLPQDILNELNCLHSCLQSNGELMYFIDSNNTLQKAKDSDFRFFEEISNNLTLVNNTRKLHDIITKHGIGSLPPDIKINFQARKVIRKIDDFLSIRNVFDWTERISKTTFYKQATPNIGFGKMGADGSSVSAVVILLCFISGWTLLI